MNTDPKIEQILIAIEELQAVAGDGPRTRKLLDSLFRDVHSLKANASANGLHDLASAAHEFENVLHSLRASDTALQQSLKEGASLFLVQTDFDVADFEQQFQRLKEKLNQSGEVISIAPMAGSETINFRILYASAGVLPTELSEIPNVTIETVLLNPLEKSVTDERIQDELKAKAAKLERVLKNFSAELLNSRVVSVESLLNHALRAGQAAALATGKQVDFELNGQNSSMDSSLCEAIADPLLHLVRNAVDHGIEYSDERVTLGKYPRGTVVIEIVNRDSETRIRVTDDGRGIDPAHVRSIFQPGFSTAPNLSEISGRGVGLDAVETRVLELGGSVTINSQPGKGSTFEIRVNSTPREQR